MNRREFLTNIGKGAAGLSLTGFAGLQCRFRKATKRNVVLVTMDTTRRDHLGCYGYQLPISSNLDEFAEEATVFENCYSTTNKTLPSHASILTGLHLYNHGVTEQPYQPLHPSITTLGNVLSKHGYKTAAITSAGFMNRNTIGNGFQSFHAPEIESSAEETTDVAIGLLDSLGPTSEKIFLWLHYWDPHYPYTPPETYGALFGKGELDQERLQFITAHMAVCRYTEGYELGNPEKIASEMRLTHKEREAMASRYDGEIVYMDHHIGRFISALKSKGFYDNSITIFTADHGESLFENDSGWLTHGFIYEPVVRVPLIIRNPDLRPTRIEGLVQSIDIAPTLLNWLGLEAPPMDGRDMNPLMFHGKAIREDILLTEAGARIVGITDGKHKMRTLTAKREKPLPTPQSWKEDAQKLPRIEFNPQPPSVWNYDMAKGLLIYSWEYPSECGDQIRTFCVEVVSERVFNPDHVVTVKEVAGETTKAIVFDHNLATERDWERVSASFPILLRIVGKNKRGENIAASDITVVRINSPIGIDKELYDLTTDPDERRNIAQENPHIVKNLQSRLKDFGEKNLNAIENGPGILRGKPYQQREMSSEDIERLKALGYL